MRTLLLPVLLLALSAAAEPVVLRDCPECPELVIVPAGFFLMGSPEQEAGRESDEGPQHRVHVSAFALGRTEVTQAQWRALMGHNPSHIEHCDTCPVEQVSWEDAQGYLAALARKTGIAYRLPSEAEWEYAARAGGRTTWPWGNDPADACAYGNVLDLSAQRSAEKDDWQPHRCSDDQIDTAPVGRYRANPLGLFDMSGNVLEWVEDCWHPGYRGAPIDGRARVEPGGCRERVLRGGSWLTEPEGTRSAYRDHQEAHARSLLNGFRVARPLP